MPKKPTSRNPYVSSTIPTKKANSQANQQWQRNRRVAPARSHRMHHRRRGLAVALIAIGLFAAVIAVIVIFFPGLFRPFVSQNEQVRVELSEERVLSDFRGLDLQPPDIANYRYVETGNLIGPRYDEASIGESKGTVAEHNVTRTATSDAIWRNRDVTVYQTVEMTYSYDPEAETWKAGQAKEVGLSVKPNIAVSAGAITADLFPLLQARDKSLADRLTDATMKTESNLTVDGGTITATLSKREDKNVLTAVVTMTVTWSDTEGWVPEITDVQTTTSSVAPSVSGTTQEQNAENAKNAKVQSADGKDIEVPQL